jgi:outer membrane protein assembly factor BamB
MMWHYQLIPHDIHDWDLNNQAEITQANGKEIIVSAGKGGIAIANDAKTGKLLWKTPIGKHNGHDNDGLLTIHSATGHGKVKEPPYSMLPAVIGGVETPYATDGSTTYFADNIYPSQMLSQTKIGTIPVNGPGQMVAIDQATGKIKWQHQFPHATYGSATVSNDLVWTTTFDGTLWALNKGTGAVVWHTKLPAGTNAGIAIDGDYVVLGAGFPQAAKQKASVVAYKLGATG